MINEILWKLRKQSLWFRAQKGRDYYETNEPKLNDIWRYFKKRYTLKFWVA